MFSKVSGTNSSPKESSDKMCDATIYLAINLPRCFSGAVRGIDRYGLKSFLSFPFPFPCLLLVLKVSFLLFYIFMYVVYIRISN